jgi:hypothetical protein
VLVRLSGVRARSASDRLLVLNAERGIFTARRDLDVDCHVSRPDRPSERSITRLELTTSDTVGDVVPEVGKLVDRAEERELTTGQVTQSYSRNAFPLVRGAYCRR